MEVRPCGVVDESIRLPCSLSLSSQEITNLTMGDSGQELARLLDLVIKADAMRT